MSSVCANLVGARAESAEGDSSSFAGHFWTVAASLVGSLLPTWGAPARPFQTTAHDPLLGPVRLNGFLDALPGADTLVLIVHGLGGHAGSPYCAAGARAA